MKKLFKDIDKRFLISLLIIIALLSTVVVAYATKVTTEMDSDGSYGTSLDVINLENQYLTAEDLFEKYDVICCYHGGNDSHLRNASVATLTAGGNSTTVTDGGKEIGKLVKADEGNQTALTISSTDPQTPYTDEAYYAESWAWYEVTEKVTTSPDNSYILAEMISEVDPEDRLKVFYEDGYSTVQYAWWVTDDNHGTNHSSINALYEEAEAFYAYIKLIAESIDVNTFQPTDYTFTDKDGTVHEGTVPAPKLNYNPEYNKDANQDGVEEVDENGNATGKDKVTVTFDTDTNTWTVGPFSINYVEESYEKENPETPQDERDPVQFAGITNAQLYLQKDGEQFEVPFAIKEDEEGIANPATEVEGTKWRFNFLKDQREVTDNYKFPHANEVFYVEIDYIEGATLLMNLHFDFKYMNAGGQYEKLEGTYYEQTWTPNSKVAEYCSGSCGHSSHDANSTCDGKCSHGYSSRHAIKWNYWLDLTSMEQKTSQLLAYGVKGARWYLYTELDLPFNGDEEDDKEWNYTINKKVVDEDGNEVSTSKKFVFDVYKDGEHFDQVKVAANVPFTSTTYKLKEDEDYPNIEIKENFDENTVDDYKVDIKKSTNEDGSKTTFIFDVTNTEVTHHGDITLIKHADPSHADWEYQFKLYIDNVLQIIPGKTSDTGIITIKPGVPWNSGDIEYTGDAPKYRVEEVNIPEGSKLYKITNKEGVLGEKVVVDAYNDDWDSGELSVQKVIDGNVSTTEKFTIEIEVGGKVYTKELGANQTWSDRFVWDRGTTPPTYKVREVNLPEGWELLEITNPEGQLQKDKKIEVKVKNKTADKPKSGYVSITKEIETDDKIGVDNNLEFEFTTRISGTFECEGESIVNGTKVITSTLKPNETWTSPEVTWKGDAPTYSVSEVKLPEGWKQLSISNSKGTMEEGKTMKVTCVNEYKIVTEYDLTMAMSGLVWEDAPLNEEDKNTEASKPNGKYDDSEQGIQNVEVFIWKVLYNGQTEVSRKLATAYKENSDTEITFPIYTTADGIWKAPRMEVPGLTEEEIASGATRADYDVEFYYDGQTYKPTDFLVSGSASDFRRGNNARRNEYNRDSMAIEDPAEREAFDNKFATITGDTAIQDDGSTNGYAEGTNGERTDLLYYSTDSIPSLDGNTRKISELQTLNEGFVREQYRMPARTSTGGLTWPFDSKYHLEYVEKYLNKIESGIVIKYHYSATYPYLLNINLGLVKRDEAELAVTKDVYSANVVVNQKLMNYKYNEYIDFENEKYQDYLNLQLKVADANISYKLDLYESDYYYRAKVYEGSEVQGALQEFYRSLGKENISDELDLDVFLTYKIGVYNNSDSYLAEVKKLTDYFDEDLELVDTKVSRYIQEANGVSVDKETEVASPAYVVKKGPSGDSMWAEQLTKSIEGKITTDYGTKINSSITPSSGDEGMQVTENVRAEDGKNYYKATIDLSDSDLRLAVGEKLEVYLTFKVRTDESPATFGDGEGLAEAVKSYVRLGTKANVAEISAYTTYYADTQKIAGKVDKDSAPNNISIENKNDKSWYEDDADSAPIITLDLYTETRDVNGMAWEDKETEIIDYNQRIGDGIYKAEDGEEPIGNLTTQMVEKVRVKQTGAGETYKEYDFVWPTSKTFDFLNGKSLKEITGFDSVTLTSNRAEDTGMYYFENIPAGNYVVRFNYGNFPYDDMDVDGNLVMLEHHDEAKTAAYEADRHPAVYNGQDFKTTKYQADVVGEDGKTANVSNAEGYIDNEWYDFTSCKYDDEGNVITHNSDAIDNEARRLEVIAYSRVLNHTITTILATANDYSADHTELYKQTNMFADTAKINLNIENMSNLEKQTLEGDTKAGGSEVKDGIKVNYVYGKTDVNGNKGTVGVINYNYVVEAIDIGLEERSNTEIVLDKEIESITLTPNTGTEPILKAVYDISYDYTLDEETGKSTYKANVTLNKDKSYGTEHLLAQNKDEEAGLQNFRYIYYDDTIAQSLNLEVKYRFTALDVGEVDRANSFVENSTPEELLAKAEEIKDQTYVKVDGKLTSVKHPKVGEFVGSIYYIGKNEAYTQSDIVVTTTIRQLIDYVDNDAVFKSADNTGLNGSWKSTTADELLETKAIDSNIIGEYDGIKNIVDDKGVAYSTTERSNLILSVDSVSGEKLANPDFIVKLVPFSASKQNEDLEESKRVANCETMMNLSMTRSIDSEINDDDLTYDNIAEIVKFENTVGKRDIETIAGNADPKQGEFAVSLVERDASATELITFTPPTGLDTNTALTIQMLIVSVVALIIVAVGIVVIKKTVLKK